MIKDIDVFILCGGEGKRLRKISGRIPKPMVRIGQRVFLDIVIDYLRESGFRRFILGIGYKAHFIKRYYDEHKIPGIEVIFSQEKRPLGTGGAVKKAKNLIKSKSFLVLNGDSFCRFRPLDLLNFHKKKKAVVSILLRKVLSGADYGMVKLDKTNRIVDFNEKNSLSKKCFVNAGIYVFDKKVFGLMPQQQAFSLEQEFFPKLSETNFFGYTKSGFFIDIGTPERYLRANKYFLITRRAEFHGLCPWGPHKIR